MMLQISDPTHKSFSDELSERFRLLRKSKGLKLIDVARLCHTTPQTIQRLETNKMTVSTEWIEKLCTALGENPKTLFSTEDNWQEKYYNLLNDFTRLHCEIQIFKECADRIAENIRS